MKKLIFGVTAALMLAGASVYAANNLSNKTSQSADCKSECCCPLCDDCCGTNCCSK